LPPSPVPDSGGKQLMAAGLTDRLTGQMGSLQEALRRLSKAATFKDLSDQFLSVTAGFFPEGEISLFRRPGNSAAWERLSHPRGEEAVPPEQGAPGPSPDGAGTLIRVDHELVDASRLAAVVTRRSAGTPYTDVDVISLRLFVALFDSAFQEMLARRNEKELIFSLNHRVLQLNSLIDTGIEVAKLDRDITPYQLALERAASLTNASKGSVTITRGEEQIERILFPAGLTGLRTDGEGGGIASRFTFGGNSYSFRLFEKESRSGAIPFEETDQLLLDALARQVHASLENRYLHEQELEKQKIDQDIAVAAAIQQRILPAELPVIEGYDVAGINIPSKSVGGDYYDCIPLADGRYALVIADVAGKGVQAALLVSSLHAYLSAYLEGGMALVGLVKRLNRVICTASTDDKFITAFVALLTPQTGGLEALNAGHNPVYLLRTDGTVQELNRGGVPLGMLDMDFPYESETLTLGSGERLLLYTDGIPEAHNRLNELYESDTPLKEFVVGHVPPGAGAFIAELINDVKRFTADAPQSDDITALYLLRR